MADNESLELELELENQIAEQREGLATLDAALDSLDDELLDLRRDLQVPPHRPPPPSHRPDRLVAAHNQTAVARGLVQSAATLLAARRRAWLPQSRRCWSSSAPGC